MMEESFAYRLKIALLRKRMTQKSLAEKIGTSDAAVSRWTRGQTNPEGDTVKRIAQALEVSIDFLYGLKDSPLPEERTGFDPSDPNWRDRDDLPQLLAKYIDDPDIGPRMKDSRVRAILTGLAAARGEPDKQGIMSFLDYALYVLKRDEPEARKAMEEEWNKEG